MRIRIKVFGRFTLVHNGVIENYVQLTREYLQDVTLKSDTDTEVVVQVIEQFVNRGLDTEEAFRQTLLQLKGSYAIALFDNENKETIYVAKTKAHYWLVSAKISTLWLLTQWRCFK